MISFVNFARITSICVVFHLGTLHGYFFHQDFWPNLNFPLEYQIKPVLNTCTQLCILKHPSRKVINFRHLFGCDTIPNKSGHLADYLDLTFIIDSGGKLSTRLYDKRDDFDFHIVNFPFLSSNTPSGPSYDVYILQLIRYARCCSHYEDFRYRHRCMVERLLSQGYRALSLEKSFKKFYGRYQDLIEKYQRSVNVMVNDSFPG